MHVWYTPLRIRNSGQDQKCGFWPPSWSERANYLHRNEQRNEQTV